MVRAPVSQKMANSIHLEVLFVWFDLAFPLREPVVNHLPEHHWQVVRFYVPVHMTGATEKQNSNTQFCRTPDLLEVLPYKNHSIID